MKDLTADEWRSLDGLLARAARKIGSEVQDADPDYRRTVTLSLENVQHFVRCELAHAKGEPCPVRSSR